jgi:DNA-binding GntR family transcriptional regulator
MVEFQTLNPRRVAEDVYDVLRESILSCDLAPGERVDVAMISTQLGISRTPVKDALQRLSAQGLIEIHARKGTFVTRVTTRDIRETFEVRAALEAKACDLLAGKLTPSLTRQLQELNAAMFAESVTMVDHARQNYEFHRLIVENSDNQRLLRMYSELNAQMQIARIHFRSQHWRARATEVVEEHNAIIDALIENRSADAQRLMEAHIYDSMQRLIGEIEAGENVAHITAD